jgi:hypothetical protein
MSNPVIESLERQLETKKEQVALNNALERLKKNKDFQKIVIEGYFHKEAVRLVSIKCERMNQSPNIQAEIIRDIDSIGCFQQYLAGIEVRADLAEGSMSEDEGTLEALRQEALEEKGDE